MQTSLCSIGITSICCEEKRNWKHHWSDDNGKIEISRNKNNLWKIATKWGKNPWFIFRQIMKHVLCMIPKNKCWNFEKQYFVFVANKKIQSGSIWSTGLSPVVPIYYWQSANSNRLKEQQGQKWSNLSSLCSTFWMCRWAASTTDWLVKILLFWAHWHLISCSWSLVISICCSVFIQSPTLGWIYIPQFSQEARLFPSFYKI